MTDTVADLLAELAENDDAKVRAVNQRHGDDHGVKLSTVRAIAKRVKKQQPLAVELWNTGDTSARLVALLICRPREFSAADVDRMLREARTPKVTDWLVGYVAMKGPYREELRTTWLADDAPDVEACGWALTADRVAKDADGLDLPALLDEIEARMKDAPDRLQWQMNTTLAQIGIHHASLRERALDIGGRLGVLEDYPTSPGCTSPYAPTWIAEMVRRAE